MTRHTSKIMSRRRFSGAILVFASSLDVLGYEDVFSCHVMDAMLVHEDDFLRRNIHSLDAEEAPGIRFQ